MSSRADFETLVKDHARQLAAAVRRVCGRRHQSLVPDVEQEVYLALWKRLGSGNEIRHPASYIYRMALLTALAVVRRQGGDAEVAFDDDASVADAPHGTLYPAERRRVIAEVLERLDDDDGRALRAYLAGFDHREIARLYGWSESVARHRVYRTLARLRAGGSADTTKGGTR